MNRLLACLLAWAVAVVSGPAASAQNKPIVIVSISPLDQLIDDVQFVADTAAPGQAPPLKLFGGQFLKGIDMTKPLGASLSLDPTGQPTPLGFVPVQNMDQVLQTVTDTVFQPVEDMEGGIKAVGGGAQKVLVKQNAGYAYLSSTPEPLKGTLPDPATVLGDLPTTYDVAVQLNVQNVPQIFRAIAVTTIQQAMESTLERLPDESDQQFQLRKDAARVQVKAIEQFLNETDQISLGLSIDRAAGQVFFDSIVRAKPGSKMAQQISALRDSKTQFGGLLNDSLPAMLAFSQTINDEQQIQLQVEQINSFKSQIMAGIADSDELDSAEEREAVQEMANTGLELLVGLIKSGRMDAAFTIKQGEDGRFLAQGGMYLPDAKRLEDLIKKGLAMVAEKDPNAPMPTFDVETYQSVNLHKMDIPSPPEAKAQQAVDRLLGAEPVAYFGFSDDTVWYSVGSGVLGELKAAIDAYASGTMTPVPPGQFTLHLSPFIQAAADLSPEAQAVAEQVDPQSDTIKMLSTSLGENAARSRITIDQGVIKLIGFAAMIGAQMQAQQAEPAFEDDIDF